MKRSAAKGVARVTRTTLTDHTERAPVADAREGIYAVVRAIPRGKVATYGQVAELAGITAGHRVVARAMQSCPERLPWQRVVGKKDARRAQINIGDPDHAALQRAMLAAEGVVFDANGFITLRASGWLPASTGRQAAATPRTRHRPASNVQHEVKRAR